jgi:glyoxylase-like metal-dependent hydrolase (beta-lactamase superfamily II)
MRGNSRTSRSFLSRQCRNSIVVKQAFTERKVGKIDVIAVSDGTVGLGLTKELVQNAKPGEVGRLLARHFEKALLGASVNAFLIKYENKLVLIDAGSSELVGPTAGRLPQSLRAAGAPPENIADVFVTHIHPDHTRGLVNLNTKVFPNATIHVNKKGRLLV